MSMNPKMTAVDAANCLGKSEVDIHTILKDRNLLFSKHQNQIYFGHSTAKHVFQFPWVPQTFVFQIVKGGTGKTSLVHEFAIRASLYGAKVLCVDMDQQGNLTHSFNKNAEHLPVMVDILLEGHPIQGSIIEVSEGIHLLPSRFENAMLDEVIRSKDLPLDWVYRKPFEMLKDKYDVIVVDCPPSLGRSVAACALAADCVIAPVTPERFALLGLELTTQSVKELEETFEMFIPLRIVLNKFDTRTTLSQSALRELTKHKQYQDKFLNAYVRSSQEFPNAIAKGCSIFDTVKPTLAKSDMDCLTQEILEIGPSAPTTSESQRHAVLVPQVI